mgnify:CR=1 FL=1
MAGGDRSGFRDGKGKDALFSTVRDVAVDAVGNVFIADEVNGAIRRITPDGTVTTLAGKWISRGERESSFGRLSRDGVGDEVRFNHPNGIAVDKVGNIYVADTEDNTIRVGRPVQKRKPDTDAAK